MRIWIRCTHEQEADIRGVPSDVSKGAKAEFAKSVTDSKALSERLFRSRYVNEGWAQRNLASPAWLKWVESRVARSDHSTTDSSIIF